MWLVNWRGGDLEIERNDGHVFRVPAGDLGDVLRDLLAACGDDLTPTPADPILDPYRVTEDAWDRVGEDARQEYEADRYDAWRDAA